MLAITWTVPDSISNQTKASNGKVIWKKPSREIPGMFIKKRVYPILPNTVFHADWYRLALTHSCWTMNDYPLAAMDLYLLYPKFMTNIFQTRRRYFSYTQCVAFTIKYVFDSRCQFHPYRMFVIRHKSQRRDKWVPLVHIWAYLSTLHWNTFPEWNNGFSNTVLTWAFESLIENNPGDCLSNGLLAD